MNELTRLEMIDSLISHNAEMAISSYVFLDFIDLQFMQRPREEQERLYKTNPANTYLHTAIKAKANSDLVDLIELIRTEEKMFQDLPVEIKHKWDLVNHRNFISHPSTVTWSSPGMAKFIEDKMQYTQSKPQIIWRAKKSIEIALNDRGGKSKNELKLRVLEIYIDVTYLIWQYSAKDDVKIPAKDELRESLASFFQSYKAQILEASIT